MSHVITHHGHDFGIDTMDWGQNDSAARDAGSLLEAELMKLGPLPTKTLSDALAATQGGRSDGRPGKALDPLGRPWRDTRPPGNVRGNVAGHPVDRPQLRTLRSVMTGESWACLREPWRLCWGYPAAAPCGAGNGESGLSRPGEAADAGPDRRGLAPASTTSLTP